VKTDCRKLPETRLRSGDAPQIALVRHVLYGHSQASGSGVPQQVPPTNWFYSTSSRKDYGSDWTKPLDYFLLRIAYVDYLMITFSLEEPKHMYLRNVILVALVCAIAAFAQTPASLDTIYQVKYAANLSVGDSYFDIMNTGANGASPLGPGTGLGTALNPVTGNICVNVYTVDPNEELVSCCSCLITPDATVHLTALTDLASAAVTTDGVAPLSISVKLIETLAGAGGTGSSATACADSAALAGTAAFPIPLTDAGMAAWGTTLHPPVGSGTYVTTETPFTPAFLSGVPAGGIAGVGNLASAELLSLTGRCASIIGNLSGHGQCISCSLTALGASKM